MAKAKKEENFIKQIEVKIEEIVKKFPVLPANIKEIIVKFSPWIALVVLIFCMPMLIGALGLTAILMPGWGYGLHYGYNIAWWISIVGMGLMAVALPGLFKRKLSSWRLMFYSGLVMAVYNLAIFDLGGLVIGTGISMYILFQIKNYYK